MNRLFLIRKIMFVGFCLTFLLGFSDIKLQDIETAVIEKDYETARNLAQTFLASNPGRAQKNEASYYLGLSELFLGEPEKARQIFVKIIESDPDAPLKGKAYIGEVDAYFFLEKYEVALHKAEALLNKRAGRGFSGLIYLKMARAHLKLGRWDEARKYLNKIISYAPDSVEAHRARQLLQERQFFSVQCGSFLHRSHAENLVEELKGRGEYAYIVETVDKDGTGFYRVRVGQLSTLIEAKNLKKKLADLGYPALIYP